MKKSLQLKQLLLLALSCFLFCGAGHAQGFEWVKGIEGKGLEEARAITVDASGYVYTIGLFNDTIDLDPGPGVTNLVAVGGGNNTFVQKLDANGDLVWAKSIKGEADGSDITVDAGGNVYITGAFNGTVDFDPGPGTTNLTSVVRLGGVVPVSTSDIFVLKLDVNGNLAWVKSMGGTGWDYSSGIAVDTNGNVYNTGVFVGTVDFFVQKLDVNGDLVWVKSLGVGGQRTGNAIAIDASGNTYIIGSFSGTVDFDPGVGIANLTSAGNRDAFVQKLDVNGNLVWVKRTGGGGSEQGQTIAVDGSSNVYAIGSFEGTVDFDPGPGTTNLTSTGFGSMYVQKLDMNGDLVWAKGIGVDVSGTEIDIVVDASGNVYATGTFFGTVDFDPGPGTTNLTSAGAIDVFVQKMGVNGDLAWAQSMGESGHDKGVGIAVDASGNVYTTGVFNGTVDFDPGPGTTNLTSVTVGTFSTDDIFIQKLGPCASPAALAEQGCTGCGEIQLPVTLGGAAPNLDTEVKKNSAYAAPNTLVWYADNNSSQGNQLQAAPTINTANTSSVSYWVAQSAGISCTSPAKKVVISVASSVSPSLSISFCPGQSINLAGSMRDYTLKVTRWEFYAGDPNNGGTRLGRARAFRGIARNGDKVMVKPSQTTDYHIKLFYRTGGPTVTTMRVSVSPNCAGPIRPIVALQGGWNTTAGQHRTDLQQQQLVPKNEPYTALGYSFTSGGGEVMSAAAQQNANIVDWVIVELRDSANPALVVHSQAGLLLKDGFIVDVDGVSLISAPVMNTQSYYLAVIHRNHLGVMTSQPVTLGTTVDFSNPQTATYGTASSRHIANGKAYMFAGDGDGSGQIQNSDNILQWQPQAGASGYQSGDYNLDGQVQNSDLLQLWKFNTGRGTNVPR